MNGRTEERRGADELVEEGRRKGRREEEEKKKEGMRGNRWTLFSALSQSFLWLGVEWSKPSGRPRKGFCRPVQSCKFARFFFLFFPIRAHGKNAVGQLGLGWSGGRAANFEPTPGNGPCSALFVLSVCSLLYTPSCPQVQDASISIGLYLFTRVGIACYLCSVSLLGWLSHLAVVSASLGCLGFVCTLKRRNGSQH